MRAATAALITHYAQRSTTIATGLKVTRPDGAVYGFTSAMDDVVINGVTYSAAQGLDVSSLALSAGLNVDNLEIHTGNDGSLFTQGDILSGVWRNSVFVIFQYNWASPTDGIDPVMAGSFGNVDIRGAQVVVELRGLQQALQQPVGKVVSKLCRTWLGSPQCSVNLEPYIAYGTITSVTSNQVFRSTSRSVYPDPYFSKNTLLLPLNGSNGDVTTTDMSPAPKAATFLGNAQLSTAQFKYGATSLLLDGTGDAVSFADNADFEFGAGDFTVELWVRPTQVASAKYIIGKANASGYSGWTIYQSGTALLLYMSSTGTSWDLVSGLGFGTLAADTWKHVALTRKNGTVRAFCDGVLGLTAYVPQTLLDTTTPLYLGADRAALSTPFQGYIDDVRITKGAARYIDDFTPPTALPTDNTPTGAGATEALDWFTEGYISFLTGENAGLTRRVKSYAADGTISLVVGLWNDVQVGDSFSMVAGCRKRLIEDCKTKFDNVLNFDGEPHVPGSDKLSERIIT